MDREKGKERMRTEKVKREREEIVKACVTE